MRKSRFIVSIVVFASAAFAATNPADRWAGAVKSIYREATIEVSGFEGTIKAWHTPEGRYRKEEQIGIYSTIETFDGTNGLVQRGSEAPRAMTAPEIARAKTAAFANWNAGFFVFFPERRRGNVTAEGDDTIVFQPEGGIDWRVTLDPRSTPRRSRSSRKSRSDCTIINSL